MADGIFVRLADIENNERGFFVDPPPKLSRRNGVIGRFHCFFSTKELVVHQGVNGRLVATEWTIRVLSDRHLAKTERQRVVK